MCGPGGQVLELYLDLFQLRLAGLQNADLGLELHQLGVHDSDAAAGSGCRSLGVVLVMSDPAWMAPVSEVTESVSACFHLPYLEALLT